MSAVQLPKTGDVESVIDPDASSAEYKHHPID